MARVEVLENRTPEKVETVREIPIQQEIAPPDLSALDDLRAEFEKYKEENDAVVGIHGKQLDDHDDRIAKLEDEIGVLKSMGAPSGDGDNGNVLEALGTMIKNLEQRLNSRMGALEDELANFVRKPTFEKAIADLTATCESLDERKADRSELEDMLAKMQAMVDGIEIPE